MKIFGKKETANRAALCLCLFAIVSSLLSLSVMAAAETYDLFEIDTEYNMAVSLLFDKEMPDVTFIDPDGEEIEGSSLESDSGEDWVQFYIEDAKAGKWQIRYDKGKNTEIEINYSSYMDPIEITSLAFSEIEGDRLPVTFTVTGEDGWFDYKIYAVVIDDYGSVTGDRLLKEGRAEANEETETEVYIGDLSDYGEYRLMLDAWRTEGVEEAFDTLITEETFEITGNSVGEITGEVNVTCDMTSGIIYVDWSDLDWGEYIVAFFESGKTEPFFFSEYDSDTTSADALFDPEAKEIRIDITYRRSGVNSDTLSKTVKIDNGVKLEVPTAGLLNSALAHMKYTVTSPVTADVTVGDKTSEVEMKDSGEFSVVLSSGNNEITVEYKTDDEYVTYVHTYEAVLDDIPPILRLPENKGTVNVKGDTYTVVGLTEKGAAVKIGGADVAVDADGIFIHKVKLTDHENKISVTASDLAGNVTAQDIIITKAASGVLAAVTDPEGDGGILAYLPLIISFAVGVGILVATLIVSHKGRHAENKKLFALSVAGNISLILSVILLGASGFCMFKYISLNSTVNGEGLFELAADSIDEAYLALTNAALYGRLMTAALIALGVCVLATAVLKLIGKLIRKKAKQK